MGAGALYLPIDGGYTAASLIGGGRFTRNERLEARIGARIAYGDSPYSSVTALIAEAHVIRWYGTFGLSAGGGAGVIMASRKGSSGWDGTLPGFLATASARIRHGALEPSFDIGILTAVGESYPAPFALASLTGGF